MKRCCDIVVLVNAVAILCSCQAKQISYEHEGRPCAMCAAGWYRVEHCTKDRQTFCQPCEPGQTYTHTQNKVIRCADCTVYCKRKHEHKISNCTITSDIVCACDDGYFLENKCYEFCSMHQQCKPAYGVNEQGTSVSDVECEPCVPGATYSDTFSSSESCKQLTNCGDLGLDLVETGTIEKDNICGDMSGTGSKKKLPLDTEPQGLSTGSIIGIISGAAVFILLAFGIIYCLRKRSSSDHRTKDSLLDISPDRESLHEHNILPGEEVADESGSTVSTDNVDLTGKKLTDAPAAVVMSTQIDVANLTGSINESQNECIGILAQKELIRRNRMFFIEHLEVDGVIAYLQAEGIFTSHITEKIKLENRTTMDRVTKFLDILQRRGPDAYEQFYDALIYTKQYHVADVLKPEEAPSKLCNMASHDPAQTVLENRMQLSHLTQANSDEPVMPNNIIAIDENMCEQASSCCTAESQSTERFGLLSKNPTRPAFFQFLANVFAGTDWKQSLRLFPGVELADQDLELVEMDHIKYKEVVYQAIRKWHDVNGDIVPLGELKKCLIKILVSKGKLQASEAIIKLQQVEVVLDYGVENNTGS